VAHDIAFSDLAQNWAYLPALSQVIAPRRTLGVASLCWEKTFFLAQVSASETDEPKQVMTSVGGQAEGDREGGSS
jgi:hypothetical protein